MIPTFSQLQPQPQTIEPIPNETVFDSPNQDTETHSSKPHSMQTIESIEHAPQEPTTSPSILMTELPLLLQLTAPITPLTTPPDETQLKIYQPHERPSEYEQPPLDWIDMDPIQRHTWLREHQLPNQKPSKLMVTETQNLTRNQILTLQTFERPRLFHAQLPKDQTNLQQAATDIQSPPHTLTITPQTPQPLLSFLEKQNYQDEQNDPNETKKQKSDNAPDESAINNDPPPQPPTPFNNSTTIIDPSQTENGTHEQPQTIKRKHTRTKETETPPRS